MFGSFASYCLRPIEISGFDIVVDVTLVFFRVNNNKEKLNQ